MSKETAFPVKKLIYLTDEQARMISDYRFDNRLNSENEAVRQLIDLGLDAAKRNKSQTE
jgi:hypothetical protein